MPDLQTPGQQCPDWSGAVQLYKSSFAGWNVCLLSQQVQGRVCQLQTGDPFAHSFARLKLSPSEHGFTILAKIVHQAIQLSSIVHERSSFGLIGCLRKLNFPKISGALPFFDLFAYPELRFS